MNKLEPNMYVRTNKGIFQIRNKNIFTEDKKQYIGVNGRYTCIDIETIEKASHNIIDLIEEGDYVNGHKVLEVFKNDIAGESLIAFENHNNILSSIYDDEIKSIVTKEQFSSMEYRLGDK